MPVAWEEFFSHTVAPEDYETICERLQLWAARHAQQGRKMALVTSGGTTVPLERNTVRFVDNFSLGTRGACSCEQFLRRGYAVLFLHRDSSVQPFVRHLQPRVLLDALAGVRRCGGVTVAVGRGEDTEQLPAAPAQCSDACTIGLQLVLDEPTSQKLQPVVRQYREAVLADMMFSIPFSSLSCYLWFLRMTSETLQRHAGTQPPLLYLAAAVADFYIPYDELSEHKLQSSSGPLCVELQQVPKMLDPLVSVWAPSLYVVSFKLETDVTKLMDKSKLALRRYHHHLVVGNLLQTRRDEVTLVEPAQTSHGEDIVAPGGALSRVDDTPYAEVISAKVLKLSKEEKMSGKEIEEIIIIEICLRHDNFLKNVLD